MGAQTKATNAPLPNGLMKRLASIAHDISDAIQAGVLLPGEQNPLRHLYTSCRAMFAPSMSVAEYADMLAQALLSSFFAAWYYSTGPLRRQQVIQLFPKAALFSRQFCQILSDAHPKLDACLDELVSEGRN